MNFKSIFTVGSVFFVVGAFTSTIIYARGNELLSSSGSETVTRVVDGDTYEIEAPWSKYPLKWKVRVRGIDTPEKGHRAGCEREQMLGAQASALAYKLISQSGREIVLRNVDHDKYGGRLLADVYLIDGTPLIEPMLDKRLAQRYDGDGPKPNWCN